MTRRYVDLSHTVVHGEVTDPGIPAPVITEHLTNLDAMPKRAFDVFAVPVKVSDTGTFPVRALAMWDE